MTIRSDIDLGLVAVATTDTVLAQVPTQVERIGITAAVAHNATAGQITLTLWESPDLTSTAGEQVAAYTLEAGESAEIIELIGQGYEDSKIIGQGSDSGLQFRASCTTYTEGD